MLFITYCNCFYFSYFVLLFDAPPSKLDDLKKEYNRDVDIIRSRIFKVQPQDANHECNIQEEMKPAPYRYKIFITFIGCIMYRNI